MISIILSIMLNHLCLKILQTYNRLHLTGMDFKTMISEKFWGKFLQVSNKKSYHSRVIRHPITNPNTVLFKFLTMSFRTSTSTKVNLSPNKYIHSSQTQNNSWKTVNNHRPNTKWAPSTLKHFCHEFNKPSNTFIKNKSNLNFQKYMNFPVGKEWINSLINILASLKTIASVFKWFMTKWKTSETIQS